MIYAISDIHGNYALFKKAVNFLKEDDELIVLGDAIDRGSDGFKILREIANNPQIQFTLGNHEDMFMKFIKDENDAELRKLYFGNGGFQTFVSYKEAPYEERVCVDKLLMSSLYGLGLKLGGIQFFLSHAGCYENFQFPIESRNFLWNREYYNPTHKKIPSNVIVVHGHTPMSEIYPADELGVYNNGRTICLDTGFNSGKLHLFCLDTLEITVIKEDE